MEDSILIVEDSRAFAMLLSRAIALEFGNKPLTARTLAEAQEFLASGKHLIAAAVVDLNLPDASHGEVVSEVISYGLPTIVLTGSYDKEMRSQVLQMDILDYLVKGGRVVEHILATLRRVRRNKMVKVLVVDDARVTRSMVRKLLELHRFQVLDAASGAEALEILEQNEDIKLVITDYHMPGMDGFDLISRIRQRYAMDELGIIGLSASNAEDITAHFLKMGANDFLYKDFSVEEFHCRVRQNVELVERFEEIKEASNRDYLTGLFNRRYFYKTGVNLIEVCKRAETPAAVAMLDIDFFKQINDNHGHEAGDLVLRELGKFLSHNSRKSDVVCRYGGEEFCFLATNIARQAVPMFFKRICRMVSQMEFPYGDTLVKFTISIGVTMVENRSLEDALKEADRLLYKAKQDGRNRVVIGDSKGQ